MELELLWKRDLKFAFSTFVIGKLFRHDGLRIIFGTNNGKVHVYQITPSFKESETLETKGSAVLYLFLENITKFDSVDLIVGDSDGNLVIFTNGEILSHVTASSAIKCIQTDNEKSFIVFGDQNGTLTGFSPPDEYIFRTTVPAMSESSNTQTIEEIQYAERLHGSFPLCTKLFAEPAIKDILPIVLPDEFGTNTEFLLVANGSNSLKFYRLEHRVHEITFPATINSICSGYFSHKGKKKKQIAVGCENGYIYLVQDYKVYNYAKVGYCVTKIVTYKDKELDKILCIGHSNTFKVFKNGEVEVQKNAADWIHTVAVADIDGNGKDEIVLGLVNNSLEVYQLKDTQNFSSIK